jgi:hypothetical protein
MESLFKHNLEAAASAALAEAEALEKAAEAATDAAAGLAVGPAAAAAAGAAGGGGRGARPARARVIDAAFLTEPLQRGLDMTIVRTGGEFELFGAGLGDVRRRSLLTAQAGRKAVAISASSGPLGTLSHNLLGTSFVLRDSQARDHATVGFDLNVGLSAAPRQLMVRLENVPGTVYRNRPPLYDPLTRTFVADFEIRGAVPSVKNFSLVGVPEGSAPPKPEDVAEGVDAGESLIELVKQSSDEFM